jgi:hypothetical protein
MLRDIASQIRDSSLKKERLEKRFKAIHKKPTDDFISIEIERAINAKDIQIRQHKLNLEIHKRAFELIKGYKFDIEKLETMLDSFSSYNNSPVIKRIRRILEEES